MSYRVDIDIIYTDLIALLRANLATLNQNLTVPFTNATLQIKDNVPRGLGDSLNPVIFIHQGSKNETSEGVSNRCRKKVIQTILITAKTKAFRQEANVDDKDNRNLQANIDELFRNNPEFSAQVIDCNPSTTNVFYNESTPYITISETSLDCEIDIRGI